MRPTSHYEAISGLLANPEARFNKANEIARRRIGQLVDDGSVKGALFMGSATEGEAHALSDLDVILETSSSLDNEERDALIIALTKEVMIPTRVLLEVTTFNQEERLTGAIVLPPNVLRWFKAQAKQYPEKIIGKNPMADFFIEERSAPTFQTECARIEEATAGWFEKITPPLRKRHHQGLIYNQADDLMAFALSLPHIAARKTLDALHACDRLSDYNIHPEDMFDVSRKNVSSLVTSVYSQYNPHLPEQYTAHHQRQEAFLQFVSHDVKTADLTAEEYRQVIAHTLHEEVLPATIALLDAIHEVYNNISNLPWVPSRIITPAQSRLDLGGLKLWINPWTSSH